MDLNTEYLGMKLRNPLVASSSPLSHSLDGIKRLEDAGAGGVVMYSLFEEQITGEGDCLDYYLSHGTDSFAESLNYFPEMASYNVGPDEYLNLIRRAKESVQIPVIGSLNGISTGGWIDYARGIEQAGADAIELNVYYIPTSIFMSGADVESIYTDVLEQVKQTVEIPVAMKLSPYFSSIAHMAQQLWERGANGLVLFNRFYQPDIDLEKLEITPRLVLSGSEELRLPLRWVAILFRRLTLDFAITSGVHNYEDALKSLMAGASVAMMASELLKNGLGRIGQILAEMNDWLEEREYHSVRQLIGSMSKSHAPDPAAFERANYMKTLASYTRIDATRR